MTEKLPDLEAAQPQTSLPVERLYSHCDSADLAFKTTDELQPLEDHLGQERAVDALKFGLQMPHDGFNIFLLGSTGVGKRELLENTLDRDTAEPRGPVYDWCYVNNFDSPDHPIALCLPRGMGPQLRRDMAHAVEDLLGTLPATFQSDEYQSRVQELGEVYQNKENEAFQALAEKASDQQIAMIQTPAGYTLAPMKDGEISTPQDFESLPEEEYKDSIEVIEVL